jgi:hypothetical protein
MRFLSQSHKSFTIALSSANNEMVEHRRRGHCFMIAEAEITVQRDHILDIDPKNHDR